MGRREPGVDDLWVADRDPYEGAQVREGYPVRPLPPAERLEPVRAEPRVKNCEEHLCHVVVLVSCDIAVPHKPHRRERSSGRRAL